MWFQRIFWYFALYPASLHASEIILQNSCSNPEMLGSLGMTLIQFYIVWMQENTPWLLCISNTLIYTHTIDLKQNYPVAVL
jgi:hypothetical protein